jgi:hypothetical protein
MNITFYQILRLCAGFFIISNIEKPCVTPRFPVSYLFACLSFEESLSPFTSPKRKGFFFSVNRMVVNALTVISVRMARSLDDTTCKRQASSVIPSRIIYLSDARSARLLCLLLPFVVFPISQLWARSFPPICASSR